MKYIVVALLIVLSTSSRAQWYGSEDQCKVYGEPELPAEVGFIANVTFNRKYKTWDELHKYFECFDVKGSKFDQATRQALTVTANHFNLPEQLLFCLFFIESRFNEKAKSHVGAQGLAQFMPQTFSGMRSLVRAPKEELLSNCERKIKLSRREQIYCEELRGRKADAESWSKLNEKFRAAGLIDREIKFQVNNRMSGIALGGFYFKRLVSQVAEFYGMDIESPRHTDIKVYKLAAGAYNQGPGNAAKAMAKTGSRIDRALAVVRKIKESMFHMDGIEHCMRTGDGQAPGSMDSKKALKCKEVQF